MGRDVGEVSVGVSARFLLWERERLHSPLRRGLSGGQEYLGSYLKTKVKTANTCALGKK